MTMTIRATLTASAAALAVFSIMPAAHAQSAAAPAYQPMQVTKVTDGVYVITGGGGNTTVRVGKDAVILVDTKNPGEPYLSDLKAKIASITPLPVKYVFITHHHGDHSGNEGAFLAGGSVIASKAEADTFRDYKTTKGPKAPPPNVAYAGPSIQVSVDGATAIGYHFGPGHTAGDTVVYFPDVKVVASGDLVADKTPNVDYVPGGGSILGWQRSLDDILALDFDYLITGHGEQIKTRADVIAYKHKWDVFIARARASIKAGTPKDKLMASIKTDDLGWTVTNLGWVWPEMLDAFYAEMSK
jgi:glyoxylase-like metal-dependent hydrolase (beta-lactamase superfamily II)